MIDARGHNQQVARLHSDPDPSVLGVTDVEIARPLEDVTDFLVFVHVLVVEHFDLVLVG